MKKRKEGESGKKWGRFSLSLLDKTLIGREETRNKRRLSKENRCKIKVIFVINDDRSEYRR